LRWCISAGADGDCNVTAAYHFASSPGVYGGVYSCPSGGILNGTTCQKPGTYSCPSGGTLSGNSCVNTTSSYSCPNGGTLNGTTCVLTTGMTCPNGGTLSGGSCVVSTIACAEPVVVSCPPGTTYTGGRCIADPTCPDGMPLDETVDGCLKLMTCPHGPGFQCMQNPDLIKPDGKGGWQCSPYTCVNAAAGEGVVLDEMSEDYLKDDGQRDEEGHCLGQMYVFNGKPSRCRPKGWTVGFIADCCKNGDLLPEDTGMGALAMTGVLWDAAQGAYAAADTFGTLSTFVNNYGDAEQFGAAVQLVEAAAGCLPSNTGWC